MLAVAISADLRTTDIRCLATAPTAERAVSGEMYKNAGKWYNLTVQVAAGQIISYTVECVIGVEPLPPADGVFVWSSGQNDEA